MSYSTETRRHESDKLVKDPFVKQMSLCIDDAEYLDRNVRRNRECMMMNDKRST